MWDYILTMPALTRINTSLLSWLIWCFVEGLVRYTVIWWFLGTLKYLLFIERFFEEQCNKVPTSKKQGTFCCKLITGLMSHNGLKYIKNEYGGLRWSVKDCLTGFLSLPKDTSNPKSLNARWICIPNKLLCLIVWPKSLYGFGLLPKIQRIQVRKSLQEKHIAELEKVYHGLVPRQYWPPWIHEKNEDECCKHGFESMPPVLSENAHRVTNKLHSHSHIKNCQDEQARDILNFALL